MKQIFTDIKNQIATITQVKDIQEDWGQLQYDQPPVKFPCALVDIQSINYSQMGNLAQSAEALLSVTIADDKIVNRKSADDFATIELMEQVNDTLHGYAPTACSRLIRQRIERVNIPGTIRIYTIVYQFTFATAPQLNKTTKVNNVSINTK